MANTFLKPTVINRTALGLLEREIVLPNTVWKFGEADFRGAANDTVTMRLPAILTARDYEWRTRNNPIVVDDITEIPVPIALDKHPYSAVAVTDEQLTLDIVSFAEQVLRPQVRAVAEKLEGYIATTLGTAPYKSTVTFAEATDDPYKVAVRARRELNKNKVPFSDRFLVMGADVEAAFLNSDKLVKVNESGSDSALRDAVIGRLAGFTLLTSNALPATAAYAYHRSAIAFANVAPAVPEGAAMGASETYEGLAMRWLRDYDPNFLRDRSVTSAFAGVTSVNDGPLIDADADTQVDDPSNVRAVKITFTPAP